MEAARLSELWELSSVSVLQFMIRQTRSMGIGLIGPNSRFRVGAHDRCQDVMDGSVYGVILNRYFNEQICRLAVHFGAWSVRLNQLQESLQE